MHEEDRRCRTSLFIVELKDKEIPYNGDLEPCDLFPKLKGLQGEKKNPKTIKLSIRNSNCVVKFIGGKRVQ